MTTQTRLRGGAESNPPVEPGTGEDPGGEEGTENPGEEVDPKPEEPGDEESGNLGTDAVKVPEWANGNYTSSMGTLNVENGGFSVLALDKIPVSTENIVPGSITKQTDSMNSENKSEYKLDCQIIISILGEEPKTASFVFTKEDENTIILVATGIIGNTPLTIEFTRKSVV